MILRSLMLLIAVAMLVAQLAHAGRSAEPEGQASVSPAAASRAA